MYAYNREAVQGVIAAWLLCLGIAGCGLASQAVSIFYEVLLLLERRTKKPRRRQRGCTGAAGVSARYAAPLAPSR
jgi:hypothetical protein